MPMGSISMGRAAIMSDFLIYALVAVRRSLGGRSIGLPVWRRMAYFGDTCT